MLMEYQWLWQQGTYVFTCYLVLSTTLSVCCPFMNKNHVNDLSFHVAYRSHKRHFALKTQNHQEMFSLMHHVVMGDDPEVKAGKPSPDIFLAAMRRFEVLGFTIW